MKDGERPAIYAFFEFPFCTISDAKCSKKNKDNNMQDNIVVSYVL